MKFKKIIIYSLLLTSTLFIFSLSTTQAQKGYQLIVPIPGGDSTPSSIGAYLYTIFRFSLYAGGILAILMIVIGGIQYTISRGNPSKIEDSTDRIKSAILGLILLFSASAILFFINPELITLNVPNLNEPIKVEGSLCNTDAAQCTPGQILETDVAYSKCNINCKWEFQGSKDDADIPNLCGTDQAECKTPGEYKNKECEVLTGLAVLTCNKNCRCAYEPATTENCKDPKHKECDPGETSICEGTCGQSPNTYDCKVESKCSDSCIFLRYRDLPADTPTRNCN